MVLIALKDIFSSQLELGLAETQSKLLRDAEIKSLQAQVPRASCLVDVVI
jgi:LytS/YehU family sensor histidine kinase